MIGSGQDRHSPIPKVGRLTADCADRQKLESCFDQAKPRFPARVAKAPLQQRAAADWTNRHDWGTEKQYP